MSDISIVIVNWNSGSQLLATLFSISKWHGNLVKLVVVVDNSSTDDSLGSVESISNWQFELRIIKNSHNKGFGTACNQGAKLAESEFLLFLNPDAQLFSNSLLVPLSYMRSIENADVGICGIQLVDESGHVSPTCSRFPSISAFMAQSLGLNKISRLNSWSQQMSEWDHATNRDVDQVIGAFFFIRRAVFEVLSGFDERFFVYFEEVDVSYRARQLGLRSVYLVDAQAFHAGGGTSQQVKAARLFYSLRSRLLYGFKHFSKKRAWLLFGVTMFVEPFSRLIFSAVRGGREDVLNTLRAYWMVWRSLPYILRSER